MQSKRQYQQEGDERGVQSILVHDSKRRREDAQESDTVGRAISRWISLPRFTDDFAPHLGDLCRRVVREELEHKLLLGPTVNEIGTSGTKLQLVFQNDLPDTIFTFSKIKAKKDTYVEIALYNTGLKSIVTDGSLSSIKIEICVLHNDESGSNSSEDWSDEFNAQIVSPKDNKGKLLKGETVITLQNGVGHINNLEITDNSKCTRTRKYRLGAKAVQSNLVEAVNIRGGRSKPFIVKDARGEMNQKHYPPSLKDETWRLTNISKNGKIHKRLSSAGINTVEDLLRELETNPASLKEKVGQKRWEATIDHAKTCPAETFDGKNYHSKKNILSSIERKACKKDMVPVEPITYDSVETFTQAIPYGALGQDPQHLQFPIALQEENSRQMNLLSRPTVGFVPQPENINVGSLSCWFPDTNPLLLFCDDGAETSDHSFFHNPTL